MIDQAIGHAILIDIHESVAGTPAWVLETLGREDPLYPPEGGLTVEEPSLGRFTAFLGGKIRFRETNCQHTGARVFDFLDLLDGVADAETGGFDPWPGLTLASKPGADEPMLHDELYESYWLYKARREAHG